MRPVVDESACGMARSAMSAVRRGEHDLLRAVADLETRGVARAGGYRSTRRLLEDLWRLDPARARRLVTQAALLVAQTSPSGEPVAPVLPATAAVHEQGLLDDAHLRIIAATTEHLARIPGLDPATFADAEAVLAEQATLLAPAGLEKVARRLINTLDPDGAAPTDDDTASGEVHLLRRRDGTLHGTIHLADRADAELVVEVFDRLSAPAGPDDPRTLAQRRADVLADLCAQAASPTGIATPHHGDDDDGDSDNEIHHSDSSEGEDRDGGDGGDGQGSAASRDEPSAAHTAPTTPSSTRPATPSSTQPTRTPGCPTVPVLGRALLAVTIDLDRLSTRTGHGLLDSDHPIDPATARRLACDAGIVPVVLGSRSEPLDVGRLSYTVPDAMRRALHARDGGCTFPGCTRRPPRCHAHHVRHWLDHGDTSIDNLTLLCRYHHILIHHQHWTVQMIDGRPVYTPPRWIDPHQRPRPGGRTPLPAA